MRKRKVRMTIPGDEEQGLATSEGAAGATAIGSPLLIHTIMLTYRHSFRVMDGDQITAERSLAYQVRPEDAATDHAAELARLVGVMDTGFGLMRDRVESDLVSQVEAESFRLHWHQLVNLLGESPWREPAAGVEQALERLSLPRPATARDAALLAKGLRERRRQPLPEGWPWLPAPAATADKPVATRSQTPAAVNAAPGSEEDGKACRPAIALPVLTPKQAEEAVVRFPSDQYAMENRTIGWIAAQPWGAQALEWLSSEAFVPATKAEAHVRAAARKPRPSEVGVEAAVAGLEVAHG
jgi:hypothetical protein